MFCFGPLKDFYSSIPGTLVSHVTLRLMKPECELDESWCQEELPTALNRVVSLLHAHTIPSRSSKGEPGMVNMVHPADTVPTMDWFSCQSLYYILQAKVHFFFFNWIAVYRYEKH